MGDEVKLYSSSVLVSSAQVMTDEILADGWNNSMHISSGGIATNTMVVSYGSLHVSSGGTTNSTTVNSDGILHIAKGGVANCTTINSNGYLYVYDCGKLSGSLQMKSGAHVSAYAGATIDFTVAEQADPSTALINNFALLSCESNVCYTITVDPDQATGTYLLADGAADFTQSIAIGTAGNPVFGSISVGETLQSGASIYSLNKNGSLLSLDVLLHDEVKLYSSGVLVSKAQVMTGETLEQDYYSKCGNLMHVSSGGTANSTTVNVGSLYVSGGGIANNTMINPGAQVWIYDGGVMNDNTVNDVGSFEICSGGVANRTTLNSGGHLYVSSGGTANNTMINSGGDLNIYSGAIINDTIVNSCVWLAISSGGTANGTILNDLSGPLSADENIYYNMDVHSGGTANSTTINSGGSLGLYGVAGNTVINAGGTMRVYGPEAEAQGVLVNTGGALYVSYGKALEIKENGGCVFVAEGASATFASNTFSGLELLTGATLHSGTTANYTKLIWSSGICGELIIEGGIANHTVLESGGYMYVRNGIANNNTVISGGNISISSAGTAYNTVLSNGDIEVFSGGTAVDTTVSGGYLRIFSGGMALEIKENGGCVFVAEGASAAFASNTFSNFNVLNGRYATVHSGTEANKITINTWGHLSVFSGGMVRNTAIKRNGELIVSCGGIHTGKLQTEDGAKVSAYQGAIIDFTVAEQTEPGTALINNWSLISGGADATYTITVKADQAQGTYTLAEGAVDFANTITVKTTAGDQLGTLAVGETKTFNNVDYTLSKNADTLSISIGAVGPNTAKSDVDGNNISDVMFQYTGGDYQIGFWMNGSSTWQGTGASQPANWELLGAYDMDSSGMADQVMFGNVLGGAYIGYYKDGDTTSGVWQNIGYLNNPDEIKWDNVIGNVTGNAGQNSIVWHAAELGAVGVWTDGTTDWVSIDGYYGTDWELQGTGDFNGDGTDEILFSNSGNLYTVDIDSNFVSLGGWGDEWQVRAIGDFSGDGTDDIVLFHKETGSVVKFANGQSSAWESLGQLDASDWFIVGAGDYNNDQKDDLLVRQYSTGMLGCYTSGDMSKWNEMGRGVDMNWTVIA